MSAFDARRAARVTVNRGLYLVTAPVRAALDRLVRARPELARRVGEWSWVWQPGWGRHRHESLYRGAVDPNGYATSPYEQQKYADILAALGERRFARGLEIGCAEGVFSRRLGRVCDDLLAVDISAVAIERAAAASGAPPQVRFERRTLPFDWPAGRFDLIVCSDVLYLWSQSVLDDGLRRMRESLLPGGLLVLQHYRGRFGQPGAADTIVDRALGDVGGPSVRRTYSQVRKGIDPTGRADGPGYRLDVLTRPAADGEPAPLRPGGTVS